MQISCLRAVIPKIRKFFNTQEIQEFVNLQPTKFDIENQFFQQISKLQIAQEEIPVESLKQVINGPYQNLSAKFLSSLSQDAYQKCLNYAQIYDGQMGILPEEMSPKGIAKYSELVLNGIKTYTKNQPFKFISLGQSPAAIARYLELKGTDIAMVPCSELVIANPKELKTLQHSESYFDYLKNFGLDTEHPEKDTIYVLCDYACSGKSLQNFFEVLKHKLPYRIKLLCQSLQDFAARNPLSRADKEFTNSFEDNFLYTEELKNVYSPIFQLPYAKADKIAQFHNESIGSNQNIRCNKLFVLWFDKMFKKGGSAVD